MDFCDWNDVVRELARWDVDRYQTIANWPVREALLALRALLRQRSPRAEQVTAGE